MISIDDRDPAVVGRRIPRAWEGDLIIERKGKTGAATLVERTIRLTILLGLPGGMKADDLADILIGTANGMPAKIRGSLTWDQGTEMARHVALTLATGMPVYFGHRHSLGERPTNEKTNGLVGEYLPKREEITSHQPCLDTIADELNDRPAPPSATAPREIFQKPLPEPESVLRRMDIAGRL